MKCPKCGYTRKMGETAPDWQCPSCGVAYSKAEAARPRARTRDETGGGGKVIVWLLVIALAGGAWAMWKSGSRPARVPADQVVQAGQVTVIMYSLTTCGFCNQKRQQLRAEGIPFVEYFLDTEPERLEELTKKLAAAGMRGGGIGTPSFEINGKILLNNPSMDTIRKHL